MKREQKLKLVAKYMKKYPEITDYQKEWSRKHTAKWIVVSKDGTAHCTCCNEDIEIGKTKHKGNAVCQKCGKELEVLHDWRASKYFDDVQFVVIPKALDNETLMMRYVYVHRNSIERINTPNIRECARLVMTEKGNHTFEIDSLGNWNYRRTGYFMEYNMYNYRSWCCLPAMEYIPTLTRELRKLDAFKYLEPKMIKRLWNTRVYAHGNVEGIRPRTDLYEKMFKVGLGNMAVKDIIDRSYCGTKSDVIDYDPNEKSLTKMLGINKNKLKMLLKYQNTMALEIIRRTDNDVEEIMELANKVKASRSDIKNVNANANLKKLLNYVVKHGIRLAEYNHYYGLLEDMNINHDGAYLYPADFRRSEQDIEAECRVLRARDKGGMSEKNELIRKIAQGLYNMPDLKEFFSGSNGLVVYVPESSEDLIREGAHLHNCLGTYIDRFARGDTLIFFIRRMEDPTAPYVAMEYRNGRVVQCRFDHNVSATGKVVDFAEALARKLAAMNILAA